MEIGVNLEFIRSADKSFRFGIETAAELGYKFVEPCVAPGYDLIALGGYYHTLSMEDDPLEVWHRDSLRYRELIDSLLRFPKPIIAAVNGPVLGSGTAFVLTADVVVAQDADDFAGGQTDARQAGVGDERRRLADEPAGDLGSGKDGCGEAGDAVTAVAEAADADALLRRIETEQPDVIISDIRMPGIDGLALLELISNKYPGLPVIITTAHSDLDSAVASSGCANASTGTMAIAAGPKCRILKGNSPSAAV